MSGDNWGVSSGRNDPLRASLVERARKRKVRAKKDPGWWAVEGSRALGDSYESYDVHLRDDDELWCACQNTKGGEYRTTCSHRTAVILFRKENPDPWEQESAQFPQLPPPPAPEFLDIRPVDPIPESESEDVIASFVPVSGDDTAGEELLAATSPANLFDRQRLEYDPIPAPEQLADPLKDIPFDPARFPTFRPNQWEAIVDVVDAFEDKVKVVFLDAAPGNGKTIMAEAVRQLLAVKGAYTCTTKDLQDQIMRDFGAYAKILKGRANYPTLDLHIVKDHDEPITAADCNKARNVSLPACTNCPGAKNAWAADDEKTHGAHCSWCHPTRNCPYQVAKRQAAGARLAVINTPYLLAEGNSYFVEDENMSAFANWPLYIIDEADQLEKVLLNYIQVELGPRVRKELGVGLPGRIGVETAWTAWLEDEVEPAILAKLSENQSAQLSIGAIPDVKADRRKKRLLDLLGKVRTLLEAKELDDGEEILELESGWVLDGWKEDDDPEKVKVTFKPIYVRDYARKFLWDLGARFLLMSGTFISPDQVASDLGLNDDEWAVVSVPSTFPPERRPVLLRGETELNFSNKSESYPVIVRQINEILDDHPGERVLIHSVSYHLTSTIVRGISRRHLPRVVSYMEAWQRARALEKFLTIPNGVIVSPSFDRGVDLRDDDCRVIIIAKVPFPNRADKQVSARLYGTGRAGRVWYLVETIRTICQMTGRGMRSEDDWCRTYILDKAFIKLFNENKRLFPKWWADAIVWDENDPKWVKALEKFPGSILAAP